MRSPSYLSRGSRICAVKSRSKYEGNCFVRIKHNSVSPSGGANFQADPLTPKAETSSTRNHRPCTHCTVLYRVRRALCLPPQISSEHAASPPHASLLFFPRIPVWNMLAVPTVDDCSDDENLKSLNSFSSLNGC